MEATQGEAMHTWHHQRLWLLLLLARGKMVEGMRGVYSRMGTEIAYA